MITNQYKFILLVSFRKKEIIQFIDYFVKHRLGGNKLIYTPDIPRKKFINLIKSNLYDTIVIDKMYFPQIIPKFNEDDGLIATKNKKINMFIRMVNNLDKRIIITGISMNYDNLNGNILNTFKLGHAIIYQSDLIVGFNENTTPKIIKNRDINNERIKKYFEREFVIFKRIGKLKYIFEKK